MTQDNCHKSDPRSESQAPGNPGQGKPAGRMYFSRQTERTIFFYLTMAMLMAGLICRII